MGAYFELGLSHILDPNGLDHVLFLIVLVITYALSDWKSVLILATAFTIGHSVTLALAALNIVTVDSQAVEILIAVSIAMTALLNIAKPKGSTLTRANAILRYTLTLIFGLVHGLGFSNFFKVILGKDSIVKPLLGFNIGVEIAQIIIVMFTLILSYILTQYLKVSRKYLVVGTSSIILFISIKMVLERI